MERSLVSSATTSDAEAEVPLRKGARTSTKESLLQQDDFLVNEPLALDGEGAHGLRIVRVSDDR